MSLLTIAATQMPCTWNLDDNLDRAEQLVRDAAAQGAQVVLLQELFATPYFCIEQDHKHLALAEEYRHSRVLQRFAALARELGVVLPLSWYEKAGNAFFNSLSVADAELEFGLAGWQVQFVMHHQHFCGLNFVIVGNGCD